MTDVVFAWSGGKDSARGLYELRREGRCRVVSLLTTVTEDYGRVSMHGFRRELLAAQADSLGLPLYEVMITKDADNTQYESRMKDAMEHFKGRGVEAVAFADIFLADLRAWRENNLARVGMKALFPIWERPTPELARGFIALGFEAVLTCVDTEKLDGAFAGRSYDQSLLDDLPPGVDPCGENGEFHSFVHAGPGFARPVSFTRGEKVLRENRFMFCDLVPA
jgi:uncharacterized protein (TIGR00290 family)